MGSQQNIQNLLSPENLTRTAKRSTDWDHTDLAAYRIKVVDRPSISDFFGVDALPTPHVPAEFLTALNMGDTTDGGAIQGIYHIDTISSDVSAKDCSPLDLVRLLFDMLEYNRPIRAVHTSSGMKVALAVCGKTTHARVDMTIAQMAPGTQVDELLVLLLQEDKRNREWEAERDGDDAEACLIASAIGAFQKYNRKREKLGYSLLEHRLFPGIVILGSSPVFYKIDVTRELAEAVKHGVCPSTTTVVERHVPAVPRPEKRDEEGMKPLDNRRIMLGCYQAMKKFISWD